MLSAAGHGIAFNAKPVVQAAADSAINVPYLDTVLYLMGISREEVEEADAAAGIRPRQSLGVVNASSAAQPGRELRPRPIGAEQGHGAGRELGRHLVAQLRRAAGPARLRTSSDTPGSWPRISTVRASSGRSRTRSSMCAPPRVVDARVGARPGPCGRAPALISAQVCLRALASG